MQKLRSAGTYWFQKRSYAKTPFLQRTQLLWSPKLCFGKNKVLYWLCMTRKKLWFTLFVGWYAKQGTAEICVYVLTKHLHTGAEGFEPPNAWTKTRCLTTWRRPINNQLRWFISRVSLNQDFVMRTDEHIKLLRITKFCICFGTTSFRYKANAFLQILYTKT